MAENLLVTNSHSGNWKFHAECGQCVGDQKLITRSAFRRSVDQQPWMASTASSSYCPTSTWPTSI